eukprot:COSAG06_NODE_745_length_12649_cov_128.650916_12_plen_45_part_00
MTTDVNGLHYLSLYYKCACERFIIMIKAYLHTKVKQQTMPPAIM